MKGLYTKFLFLIIGLFSALGIVVMTFIYVSENLRIEREGLTKAKIQERMAVESIYTSMQQGGRQEDINKVIERLRGLGSFTKLYFVRGEPVIRQFGMRRPETPSDEVDYQGLNGKEIQLVRWKDDYRLVRHVTPVAIQVECQNCHRARVGEILGVVSSEISLQELDRNLRQHRNLLALVIISGVFLFGLSTFLALKRMVILPLQKIRKGVREIASGNLKTTIPSLGQDEIGELGRGFENMREKLARWGDELETKVKERTESLLRSEEIAERLAQENEVIAEIGRIISSTLNIEEVYEPFAKEASKLIPIDRIAINLLNPEANRITSSYISGVEVEGRKAGDTIPFVGSISEEILRTRKSLLIQTEDQDELVRYSPTLLTTFQAGLRSMISVPLIAQDQVMGIIHIRAIQPNAYTERDVQLAERMGAQIAGAIANAELYTERKQAEEAARKSEEEAKRLAKENEVIAEIGKIISSTFVIEEVYEGFAEKVRELVPCDRIVVNLNDLQQGTITQLYVSGMGIAGRGIQDTFPFKGSTNEEVMRTRSGFIIHAETPQEMETQFPSLLKYFRSGIRSFLTVPLFYRKVVIGALHFRTNQSKAYKDRHRKLAERIGDQISGMIANAQLFIELKKAEEAREKLIRELQEALANIKILRGMLPICSSCKKIRDDKGYWNQIESYIRDHTEAEFTHGICPECMKKLYPDLYERDPYAGIAEGKGKP